MKIRSHSTTGRRWAVTDRISDSTNGTGVFLEFLGVLVAIASLMLPFLWYRKMSVRPALDWPSIWPICLAALAFLLGLMSLALGYGLRALSAVLDNQFTASD